MSVSLDDLDAAGRWWAVWADGDDYAMATTAEVLKAAHGSPVAAAHCAVLERAMPTPDEWLVGECERLAGES